ncbi:MAG: esterase family protein, partial [Bacteroidales bacterium]|nr:esterase family protein [Bacteroidales bacterium]
MKAISLLFLFWSITSILMAQEGKVFDDLSMESKILKMDRKYAVYLPPDYETSQRSYPVLYLLHGGGNNQSTWVQHGEVMSITDKAIKEGIATPMIIVMPDASGEHRGYTNDPQGEWLFEDFFFQEFMPFIEKTYRIRPVKRYRAIAGLSMGGKGTFIYALHHPELFVAACPLSAGAGPPSVNRIEQLKERLSGIDPDMPDSLLIEYYYRQMGGNILELINNIPDNQIKAVRWYVDCGDDDPNNYEGNCLVHIAMRKKEIPHEFRIRDGAHT